MIAEVFAQPEITYTALPAAPAPEPVFEPEAEAVEPEPAPEPIVEQVPEPLPEPVELPRTATPLPLIAVGGFSSLLVGLGIGLLRRRVG
jgi:Tfp pilus assembly protein FimV